MKVSRDAFPIGTDSILLADFTGMSGVSRFLDMGSGSGILSVLLLTKSSGAKADLVEIMPAAAELSRENMALAGFSDRTTVKCGDLRAMRAAEAGRYDLIITNPPYFSADGVRSPDPGRSAARDEGFCTLKELAASASGLLGTGGRFTMVYPAARLAEAIRELSSAGLEPKRLRLVQARADKAPGVFLLECRRGGGVGLTVEPTLILRDSDGSDTDEVRCIYHLS